MEDALSWEDSRSLIPPEARIVVGFDNDTPGLTDEGYQIAPGKTLTVTFHVLSREREERLLWTMIVDGTQVPFTADGQGTTLFPTHLGPGEEASFVLETPSIPEGFHNLALIAFVDYDDHSVDSESRYLSLIPTSRSIVWSGDVIPVPTVSPNPSFGSESSATVSDIWISRDRSESRHDVLSELHWTIKPGEKLDYFVHVSGSEQEASTGVQIVAFLNYFQTPCQPGQAKPSLTTLVQSGEHATARCSLTAPEEEGFYELQLVRINSIDRPISTIVQPDEAGRYPSYFILSSQRVLLEVRSEE